MIKEAVQRGSSDNTIKPGGWLGGAVPPTIAGGGRRSVGRVCSRFHAPAGTHNGMCASDGMQVEGVEEAGGVSRMDTERRKNGNKGGEEGTEGAEDDGVRGDDPPTSSEKSRTEGGMLSAFNGKGGMIAGVPSVCEFTEIDSVGGLEGGKF